VIKIVSYWNYGGKLSSAGIHPMNEEKSRIPGYRDFNHFIPVERCKI
jgi:hypothetical protein